MATFKDYLENNSLLILHGALGTEMEALGYDISGKLWSAKYLLEKSEVIQELHETYVAAGADLNHVILSGDLTWIGRGRTYRESSGADYCPDGPVSKGCT